ncbi:MAG TPA: SRPBCC family protein [Baekduia sp.]|nr:SRPBCC family protein [Baekduia sp.]
MGIDVTAEVTVARPRDEVAAFMVDPANDPQWIGGLREAALLGDPPLAVGSRTRRVASFLGRRIDYVLEVAAYEPGALLDLQSVVAPFPMRVTYSFADAASGATVVRNRVRGGPTGAAALLSPVTARMVRRNVERDLRALRELLERR